MVPNAAGSRNGRLSPGSGIALDDEVNGRGRREVAIGVIGCGQWGPNHVRVFGAVPGATVTAAADPDPSRLVPIRELSPATRLERDHRRLLEDSAIDAVVIATPTATHYRLVKEALEAGKHVLCEKPLCRNAYEARELVELAGAKGAVLMVGHVFLFNPGILKVKELVDASEFGTLQYLSATRTNLGPIRGDVNAAYDLAAHDIAIFSWMNGAEPVTVSANGASFLQPGIEDVTVITLRYPGNVLATIHTSWLNPKKVREITVVGTRQMVTWDDLQGSAPVALYDKGASSTQEYGDFGEFQRVSMWEGDIRLPKVESVEPLRLQALEFIRAIEENRPSRSGASFARGIVEVLEAIGKSITRGGEPIAVGG